MASHTEHYENFLASRYSWIFGGAAKKLDENRRFFSSRGIVPSLSKKAIDLGCGPGFQSIPLAEAGFEVTAIDTSRKLLDELATLKNGLDITAVETDIMEFTDHISGRVELAVCMGDTLAHFQSFADVERLFVSVFSMLEEGGKFVLTFRDMSAVIQPENRFIPVRSDENALFSCFLEPDGDYLTVHDILHTRDGGGWKVEKSFYRKLRMPPQVVVKLLEKAVVLCFEI